MRSLGLFSFTISPHRSQHYHRVLYRLVTFNGLGPSSRLDDYTFSISDRQHKRQAGFRSFGIYWYSQLLGTKIVYESTR